MKQAIQNNKKIIALLALGAVVLIALVVFALEKSRATDLVKDPFYKPSAAELEQQRIDAANKADSSLRSKDDMRGSTPGVDTSRSTSQIPTTEDYSIVIASFSQNSGAVSVSATIQNQESGVGTCSFTFTKENAKPVVRTAAADNQSCATEIPEFEFTATGEWNLEVRYFSNDKQAVDARKVTIQ